MYVLIVVTGCVALSAPPLRDTFAPKFATKSIGGHSAIRTKITLISDHNRSTMDTGDDDWPGWGTQRNWLAVS